MTVTLKKPPIYKIHYFHVLMAVVMGVLWGYFDPSLGDDMKLLGGALLYISLWPQY